jgi:hypothetical protein
MALFTDGPVSSIEDLTARDSQLLAVASVEGIDVTQKLVLAQDEIALELGTLLTRLSYVGQLFWVSPQPNVGSVVVSPALKLWHTLRALALVYSDAYNSQLNDRYAGKRDQFGEMAKWAYNKLVDTGIGIASYPIPQAAAPQVVTAVALPPAAQMPDGTYYVTMAWTNSQGEEGACAVPTTISTSTCTIAVQPGTAPPNATGWNVYIGATPDSLSLENEAPIAAGAAWLQPGNLAVGGRAPGSGQSPSYVKPVPRMIQRG